MTLGYTDGKTKIKIFLLIFGLLSISSLTIFELRKVISGPKLTLLCDKTDMQKNCDSIQSTENIYKLQGQTKNVTQIVIGDRKIYINTDGKFQENILLYPGQNLITIKSLDRFGKEIKKEININYNNKLSIAK